jgi:putative ABC transport system substrate-binding protein
MQGSRQWALTPPGPDGMMPPREGPSMERRSRLSRRAFVGGAVGLGLVAGCGRLPGQGQAPARIPRVGVLFGSVPVSPPTSETQALWRGLAELGYTDGQNIILEYHSAEGREEYLPDLAAELVRMPVDIILAAGEPVARAVAQASTTIPIIMATSRDPVGSGLIASLARPGGQITGLSLLYVPLTGKRLELLKQTVPAVSRVAALGPRTSLSEFEEAQVAAPILGLQLHLFDVSSPEAVEAAVDAASGAGVDALLLLLSPVGVAIAPRMAELAAARRLPLMAPDARAVRAGGLMSYGPSIAAMYHRTAYYVDRILKGAKPADLPVEQPMTFDFVVNLKTAQALGITFPNEILLQVTEVIP